MTEPEIEKPKKKGRVPIRSSPAFLKAPLDTAQGELFPASLDEMVDADDPCRIVSKLVDLLDLSALIKKLPLQGGACYHPKTMLKLAMFAAWDGERGSRRIEKRCRTDIRYKWLLAGLTPDHTTIWRFRHTLGPLLEELLAECVRLGKKAGLEGLGRASIDGTKLPCAASQWRKFREEAEAADEDLTAQMDAREQKEKEKAKAEPKKKKEPLPCKDPDARTMPVTRGGFVTGYNTQVLVDRDTDLALCYHFSNEASDAHQLAPTLYKCLDRHGELPEELLADAGYDSPLNALEMEETGVKAWIACKEKTPFWKLDDEGRPVCPAGHAADRSETFAKNGGRVTRLSVRACPACPLKKTCLKKEDQKEKTISFDARAQAAPWIRMKLAAKSPEGKAELKERGRSSEFAFARMKKRFGFSRLTHWGLKSCGVETGIVLLAMNLAILGAKLTPEALEKLRKALLGFSGGLERFWNGPGRVLAAVWEGFGLLGLSRRSEPLRFAWLA